MVCLAQISSLPRPCRCTRAPTQRALVRQQIEGEGVVPDGDVGPLLERVSMMARMTSKPVASPRAWTMRRWLWPPSRVRARWPSFRSNLRAQADQVVDLRRRLADHHLDDVAVAQARRRRSACPRCGSRSDPPATARRRCRPGRRCCCSAESRSLVTTRTCKLRRHFQGRPQPGDAAADDEHVGEQVRRLLGTKRDEITRKRHG